MLSEKQNVLRDLKADLSTEKSNSAIHVTSFSSISFYSNVRLISKLELEQNFQSTM